MSVAGPDSFSLRPSSKPLLFALFVIPLIEHHDRSAYEIFCYSMVDKADDFTKQISSRADVWRNLASVSAADAADAINEDGIDILVDLSGYSGFVALGTFGRIRNDLQTINTRLGARFNQRWRVSGSVGGATFNDCLLHFEFRYVVPTITNEAVPQNQTYISDNGGSVAAYKSLAGSLETSHSIHLIVDVIDPPTSKTSNLSGNKLQLRSDQYNNIDTFVAQHLGISTAAAAGVVWPNQNLLLPIVGKVLTGATIAAL